MQEVSQNDEVHGYIPPGPDGVRRVFAGKDHRMKPDGRNPAPEKKQVTEQEPKKKKGVPKWARSLLGLSEKKEE